MKDKVEMILKHNINCFINRCVCVCVCEYVCVSVHSGGGRRDD